ncbi:hypothetical protein [Streptomyces sp. NPDC008001]|uniref:hypothetical protein n=1 Tax=Streptomyces sp. NPDC008001 TaxID=3364804 RepID=UPI0036EC31F2
MRYRSRHRTAATAAAVLCVLPFVQGRPAAATEAGSLSAYRTASGAKAVRGALSEADGPVLGPGTYTDTIAPGGKKFYSVELDAKSDVYVSVVAAPAPGVPVSPEDGVRVSLRHEAGEECGVGEAKFHGADSSHPLADYAVRSLQPGVRTCRRAGRYHVVVERAKPLGASGAFPTELKYMAEPGLKKNAATTAASGSRNAGPAPAPPAGASRPVVGGTGFNDAAPVGAGTWKDEALPGQTRFYRIPVPWGQRISVTADVPRAFAPAGFNAPGGVRLALNNPARGFVAETVEDYQGRDRSVSLATAPVAYDNRRRSRGDAASAMRIAGWYYLQVGLHPKVGEVVSRAVPVTLRITLDGAPRSGPVYDGDATAAGFGVTADPEAVADDGSARREMLRTVGYAGVSTGSALLCWLGGWWFAARRPGRRRSTWPRY